MRVIAGTFRSRPLAAPRGTGTRPTSDRLREALFNILAPRLPGCRFADLYAGTGAVGIEALSRGAGHVWFAENAPAAVAALRANLKGLGIAHGFTLEERGAGALLERLAKTVQKVSSAAPSLAPSPAAPAPAAPLSRVSAAPPPRELLDVVFLDPPWDAEAEYSGTLQLLGSARGLRALAPGALVVAEHNSKTPLSARFGELIQTRTLKQGDAALSFYAAMQDAVDEDDSGAED